MNNEAILNLFNNQLEIKSEKIESSHLLVQKTFENESKIHFTNEEATVVKDYIKQSFFGDGVECFYIHLHDNIVKELVFCDKELDAMNFLGKGTHNFIKNPAKEGGSSLFGMVDTGSRALLTFFFSPCGGELEIFSNQLKKVSNRKKEQ